LLYQKNDKCIFASEIKIVGFRHFYFIFLKFIKLRGNNEAFFL
jgi:hypothetical protein